MVYPASTGGFVVWDEIWAISAEVPRPRCTDFKASHVQRIRVWKCLGLFFHLMILWIQAWKSKAEFFKQWTWNPDTKAPDPSLPPKTSLSYAERSWSSGGRSTQIYYWSKSSQTAGLTASHPKFCISKSTEVVSVTGYLNWNHRLCQVDDDASEFK